MSNSPHTPTNIEAAKPNQTLLEARRPLKEDIEKLISPYRHDSAQKPPFSGRDVAIMAISSSSTEYVDEYKMVWWTIENFAFFKQWSEYNVACFLFHEIFWNYDVPVMTKTVTDPGKLDNLDAYTIQPAVARLSLREHLEPKREGTFRFLDLPAELRNRVYTMLLDFSDAEISVERYKDRLLSSLRCRACVRSEALPIFYSTNVFHFRDLESVGDLPHGLSANQLKYIKKVHLHVDIQQIWDNNSDLALVQLNTTLAPAARGLNKLLPLEQVTLTISDSEWLYNWSELESYEEIEEMQTLLEVIAKAKNVQVFPAQGQENARCDVFNSLVQKTIESMQ
ncbi:hypothetical protein PRZ48_002445 [Zasmidium cellare]|uniref:DUF7730 domain-containing protein n=1 Tax=Zasmidium cellare TaxID=395010 RepID=A0ABR0F653_ZASCE|nr:hypothetical protein PRZ48_002445 [Zasmidium cellare]